MSMVRAIQVKVIWQTSDALPASISSITLMQLYIVFFLMCVKYGQAEQVYL